MAIERDVDKPKINRREILGFAASFFVLVVSTQENFTTIERSKASNTGEYLIINGWVMTSNDVLNP